MYKYYAASLFAILPIVKPCTNIESNNTKYVTDTNILVVSFGCSDNANATEMPPRNPLHVNIAIAFLSKLLLCFNTTIGKATDNNRNSNTMRTAAPPSQINVLVKETTR